MCGGRGRVTIDIAVGPVSRTVEDHNLRVDGYGMVSAPLLRLLACVLVLLLPGPALAWGDIGHRIICEIAFQELEPTARERVKAMIRRDPEFNTFAEACSWPDHPRRRAEEHYVNLPRDTRGFVEDACPLADKCVISAIEEDLASRAVVLERERAGTAGGPKVTRPLGRRRPPAAARVFRGRPRRQRSRYLERPVQLGSSCGLGQLPHRGRLPR